MHSHINRNIRVLAKAMNREGIQRVEIAYTGSGDSGDEFDMVAQGQAGTVAMPQSRVNIKHHGYVFKGKRYIARVRKSSMDFETAVSELYDQCISHSGHNGWENGDGGGGEFTLYAEGRAILEHSDWYTDSDYRVHTLNSYPVLSDPIASVVQALKGMAGVLSICLSYEGDGDEGRTCGAVLEVAQGEKTVQETLSDRDQDALPKLTLQVKHGKFDLQTETWSPVARQFEFEAALDHILDEALTATGNAGYHNGSGGQGELLIHTDGTALLRHTDFIGASETATYRFGAKHDEKVVA